MEFVKTTRGARALVCDGYKYVVNRRGRDRCIYWRCGRSRECSGSVSTLNDQIISRKDIHNHPPDDAELEAEKVVNAIKQKAQETARPIPTIYTEEIQVIASRSDREEIAAKLPTLESIKSSLYRHRRSRLPPLPQSRAEVHFDGKTL